MRVSIITPSYNRAVLLPETIDSILGQEYPDLEYLVLDDGSTDDTQDVLARYAGRIRVIHHENMGETATVNKGFSLVTGEIVCVVSSDDPLLPGAISHVVAGFGQNPEAVAVYPDWVDIGEHGQFLRAVRLPDYDVKNMLTSLSWGIGPGAFFRRQLIAQIGGRNSSRVYCGDMEFWAIAAMQGRLVHLPRLLATHRTHQDSASVGQLGGNFANEWVETWKDLLQRPELPKDVRALAPALMEKVRVSASKNYVGSDKGVAGLLLAQGKYLLPAINQLRRAPEKRPVFFARCPYRNPACRAHGGSGDPPRPYQGGHEGADGWSRHIFRSRSAGRHVSGEIFERRNAIVVPFRRPIFRTHHGDALSPHSPLLARASGSSDTSLVCHFNAGASGQT